MEQTHWSEMNRQENPVPVGQQLVGAVREVSVCVHGGETGSDLEAGKRAGVELPRRERSLQS